MSFGLFVFVTTQASVETNTNQSESTEYKLSSSKRAKGSRFVSFGLFVFVKPQASVETNTNQTNLPNID